jgi:hypothetical protein
MQPDEEAFEAATAAEDDDPLSLVGEPLPEDELHAWDGDVCTDCGERR